jgi:cell wall-associated NlpC family hydrolase
MKRRKVVSTLIGVLALATAAMEAPAAAATVDPGVHNGPQGAATATTGTGTAEPSATPAALPSVTSSQIIANADNWYIANNNPPYSQSAYWASRTDYAGDGRGDNPRPGGAVPAWREDCSGFVAHAWGVVTSGGGFTTYTMPSYSTPIAWSQLQPGDAILFNSVNVPGWGTVDHVGLFLGWNSATTYSVMDESSPGTGTMVQNNIPLGRDGFWQYGQPVRYLGFGGSPGTSGTANTAQAGGYLLAGSQGGIYNFGAPFQGSMGGSPLNAPVVGVAPTPDHNGYFEVASDGGIFTFGDARFAGSAGNIRLAKPIVGMAVDPATGGYWMVASDGGVFSYNAPFLGSMGNKPLNRPVVGMAATPDGQGYYLVASDGGIFNFGDAAFRGSTGNIRLNQPIVGMAATPSGSGYWLVASDGGIFTFNAPFLGSMGAVPLNRPVVGMAPDASGGGYWEVASDGGIFTFGNAPFMGSTGATQLAAPIVGMAAGPA